MAGEGRGFLFDHEKLEVYRQSLLFATWCERVLKNLPGSVPAQRQLERSATSIPLNIAEGNGKYTQRDRCRFFDIARGSALESSAALDLLVCRGLLDKGSAQEGKQLLHGIVNMLVGLIRTNSSNRTY